MSDVKTILELIEAGDSRLKAITETQATNQKALQEVLDDSRKTKAEKDEAIAKINAEFVSLRKEMTEIEKKANRPRADGGKQEDTAEQAEYRKAFGAYLRTGEGDSHSLKQSGRKAMNSTSDPDGGYLIMPEMDMAIDRVVGTIGAMARLANTVTIGVQKWQKLVKTSGMAMARVANGATAGETTEPRYAQVEIEVFPAEVEPWVHNETLADSRVNLEADLADEAAIGFAEGANAEFITGNGVGKARGITAYTNVVNSSYAWGSVGYIRSGKSGAFMSVAPSDRVINLQHALKSQYRPGAVWLTNDTTLGVMRQMKDGSGSYYLWQPDPSAAFGGRFLGSPVEIDDNMPALAAASYSLAYGNFKRAYTIVNRAGTTLIRDNITAKGQTKFNFRRRFGGGISNFEAVKLMAFVTGT